LLLTCVGCTTRGSGSARTVITVDGSSTVQPLTQAVAEVFIKANPDVRIEIRASGTTSGFERFCRGELDIQDASRPIEANETAACRTANVGYVELPVAHDGLTIIVHPTNRGFATARRFAWANRCCAIELTKCCLP
jgi:phosphate transport system substrate-binding protein